MVRPLLSAPPTSVSVPVNASRWNFQAGPPIAEPAKTALVINAASKPPKKTRIDLRFILRPLLAEHGGKERRALTPLLCFCMTGISCLLPMGGEQLLQNELYGVEAQCLFALANATPRLEPHRKNSSRRDSLCTPKTFNKYHT